MTQEDQTVDGQTEMFPDGPIEPFADWSKEAFPPSEITEGLAEPAEMEQLSELGAKGVSIKIAPELLPLLKPVGDFKMHPRNQRKHNIGAIAESLKEFGIQSPMVAQKSTGFVCKGNGTFKTLVSLGVEFVPVSVEDFDDDTAFRYLLADNRASDLATYDRDTLVDELQRLVDGPRGLQGTLWGADDIDDLRAAIGKTAEVSGGEFKGGYSENPDDLAKRQGLAAQPADKMREVPIVMTLDDHARFMVNVGALKKAYGTSGVIATIVEAVRREAELHASPQGVDKPVLAAAPEAATPTSVPDGHVETDGAAPEPTEEELLERLAL